MTKADLIANIYEKVGLSKKESTIIVELIFEIIRSSLEHGDKVKISGFGNFNVRSKKVQTGQKPADRRRDRHFSAQCAYF